MSVPGLRIVTKYWKRYAFVLLLGSCLVLTIRVMQGWMLNTDGSGDVYIADGEIIVTPAKAQQAQQAQPAISDKSGQAQGGRGGGGGGGDAVSLRELEMRNAKLEAELKYEKLRGELINRDLRDAKKQPAGDAPNEDTAAKLQERRRDTVKRICAEGSRTIGTVHTLMTSRLGMTYCLIPGVMDTFWLRVMRFVNRDYVLDVDSPFEISKKDAHERPFIRSKQIKWTRLSEKDKTDMLQSKIFMTVQNPFMRLWELYIHNLVLPTLWSTVGVKIEAKRKSNVLIAKTGGGRRKFCGKDNSFEEFILYALESSETAYEPYNRLCDPCQLRPTFIVKTETARADMEKVLHPFNLDYIVTDPNYVNNTMVKYIHDLITDIHPRFMRSKAENCVTPGDIGNSLWKALKMEGLIRESSTVPLVDDAKTPDKLIQMITDLYVGANLNVGAQKARMMVSAYKMLSANTKDAIKKKYTFDFQLFEYSDNVEDAVKGL